MAYLEINFTTESSLSLECDAWFSPPPPESERNKIPEARLRQIPTCPPTRALAAADFRFRREEMNTAFGSLDTGYVEAAMKFYYPEASICYLQIVMGGRYILTVIIITPS